MLLLEGLLLLYIFLWIKQWSMYDCFWLFVLMRFNGTLIYDYVYVVMFDYVVQVGELLKILCVELHNQCDNAINQCYFIFALWSIMGLDTYYCLIFYGLTLIHLTDPLTQVVQIMCVMCDIYIYIYVCMYIYLYKCKWKGSLLLLGWKNTHSWEHTLRLNLEEERKELIEPGFSHHYWIELLLEHQWRTKWFSITLIKVNISFIVI